MVQLTPTPNLLQKRRVPSSLSNTTGDRSSSMIGAGQIETDRSKNGSEVSDFCLKNENFYVEYL
jgi:hypothetical protein